MLFDRALELSQLSIYEFILLVGNYNDAWDGSKNRVAPELQDGRYTPEQLELAQSRIKDRFEPFETCGLRFTKPFGHLKFDLLSYVLLLFENYERGSLPFTGTVSEQPAQIMEIFNVLRQLKHEVESRARTSPSAAPRN